MALQTLNDIAYSIFETVRGTIKDDDDLDIRLIKEWIHSDRSYFIKQQLDKMPFEVDHSYVQSVLDTNGNNRVEMAPIDVNLSGIISSGSKILRSVNKIPEPLKWNNNLPVFTRVGPTEVTSRRYTVVSHERALYSGNGRFNSQDIYAFYLGGYIYIISKDYSLVKGIKYINVDGIFQKPTDINTFNDETSEYPVSRKLRNIIENNILSTKFRINLMNTSDKENDSTHKLEQ